MNENFFNDPSIDNPFADPAIRQLNENSSAQARVEEYRQLQWTTYSEVSTQPAVMEVTQDVTAKPSKPNVNVDELQRKQQELEKKEEELTRREKELHQGLYIRRNNWPPLPNGCCVQPCFYQDINVDIPLEFQKIIRHLYYLWVFHGFITFCNIIGGIIIADFTIIAMGTFYAFLFLPASYMCWFRPIYKAFRSDSSFNFIVFFLIFFFQFVVTFIQFVGLPRSGTIGIITAVNKFRESSTVSEAVAAIIELFIAFGFGCAAAADLVLISKVHRIYHSTGASFAKAQAEFATGFLRNEHIRNAASNIASAAVQSQANSGNVNLR